MTETKHTPGPWRLRRNEKEAPDDMIVMDESGASVADCSPGNPYMTEAEAEGNARLIAAATDLLEACKASQTWLSALRQWEKNLPPEECPGASLEEFTKVLRGAIAKAEGKDSK